MRQKLWHREFASGLLLLLIGGWVVWYVRYFPKLDEGYPGPSLFPSLVGWLLLLIGVFSLGQHFLTPSRIEAADQKKPHYRDFVLGIATVILYPILQPLIGSLACIFLVCITIGLLLRVIWWQAALTAAIAAGFIYLIFQVVLGVAI